MTHQVLYSLRTDGDDYRISKFTDGEVESSYLTTIHECQCPAGARPSCRHRQMLPQMLAHKILNTHWFWSFDLGRVVDFNGELKSNIDAMNELAAKPHSTSDELAEEVDLADQDVGGRGLQSPERPQAVTEQPLTPHHPTTPKPTWRRL